MSDIGATLERLAEAQKAGWHDIEILPCGCVMGLERQADGSDGFGVVPCAMRCKYYAYMQVESARQGKRAEFRFTKPERSNT